jgi:hypothetical protein
MVLQVQKQNKQYLQSSKLVHGVFSKQPTGQVKAQLLCRPQRDNQPIVTQSFFSKIHNHEIDVVKFSKFLQDKILEKTMEKLQADPLAIFHHDAIKWLVTNSIDIWDQEQTNEKEHLIWKEALLEHTAHSSTQHNNQRLVKLGALMASTGKSKIVAGVFAVASNNFMMEFHDGEPEEAS